MQTEKRLIFAHRGLYDKNAPENSLAAFGNAISAGLAIELDVRLTKDGIPVVFHDKTLRRMCKSPKKISDLTFDELQKFTLGDTKERIPSLAEALALIDGKVPLLVETKLPKRHIWHHRLERKMLPFLREYRGEFMVQSFNKYSVRWLKRRLPEIKCGILSGSSYPEPDRFDFISYKLSGLSVAKVNQLRKRYPLIFVWSTLGFSNEDCEKAFTDLKIDAVII